MGFEEKLSKSELKELKKAGRKQKFWGSMGSFWGLLILLALVESVLIAGTFSFFPESGYKSFMETHFGLSIVIFFALPVIYIVVYIILQGRSSKKEAEFCESLAKTSLTPEELIEAAEANGLDKMFPVALDKRMKELGITKVPAACTDGREVFRLPTKEDLE